MAEESPKCLGCCNARPCSIAVSIIHIVIFTIFLIPCIFSLFQSNANVILITIVLTFLLYINVKLIIAILKHDIAPIRLWLVVYLVLFILVFFLMICIIVIIPFMASLNPQIKHQNDLLLLIQIMYIILGGVAIIWYYPVYQVYVFEEKRLQQTGLLLERQNFTV